MEVQLYKTAVGKEPLTEWLDDLRDGATRARIAARLDRLKSGLLGDWKTVGDGVCELRIDIGPGFRAYFGREGNAFILLLCGGDKSSQLKDIDNARAYWKDYKARAPKPPVPRIGTPSKRSRHRRIH